MAFDCLFKSSELDILFYIERLIYLNIKFEFSHFPNRYLYITPNLFINSVTVSTMHVFFFTVFAYGATGAGKTHTMLGSASNPGVIFLTMMELYRRMEEVKDTKTCDIAVSYLEVGYLNLDHLKVCFMWMLKYRPNISGITIVSYLDVAYFNVDIFIRFAILVFSQTSYHQALCYDVGFLNDNIGFQYHGNFIINEALHFYQDISQIVCVCFRVSTGVQ